MIAAFPRTKPEKTKQEEPIMNRKLIVVSLLVIVSIIASACAAPATSTPPPQPTPAPLTAAPPTAAPPTAVPPTEAQPTPQGPNVLKVAATANVTTWDPVKSFSTEALYMGNLYEQLLRINPPGSKERFTPLLAESWESSADGLTWTFNLRPNVKFHDGEPLTAEAVKKSIEASKDHGGASFIWGPVKSIEAVDDLTVKFTLDYAAPLDLIASSLYGAWIVSPKALDAAAKDDTYFEKGVAAGTGPYRLESYIPDKEVLLSADPAYWGGWNDVKHFDKVLITITPEAVQQQQMLDGGEVDLALSIPLENIGDYKDKPGYTFHEEPSFFNYVGLFNTTRQPLDNKLVRQALSYAIPYDDIIKLGAQGYGTQSRGPVPEGVWPWSADVPQYKHDPDKARELLQQAGVQPGDLKLKLTYASENQNEERFAPLIKDAFAEVGVDVSIEPLLFNQQWELAKADPAKAQDIFLLLYWPTYSDAGTDNLWSLFHSSKKPFFNLSYWKNDQFDKLIDDAATLTVSDPQKSQQMYTDAMKLLVDEAPGAFFYDTKAVFAIPDRIRGFQYNLNYPFTQFFYPLHTQ
jgi:peptide/nickel transport system substrate-binding protein